MAFGREPVRRPKQISASSDRGVRPENAQKDRSGGAGMDAKPERIGKVDDDYPEFFRRPERCRPCVRTGNYDLLCEVPSASGHNAVLADHVVPPAGRSIQKRLPRSSSDSTPTFPPMRSTPF